ncbi:MAG: hypothetical protein OJF52_000367 [Nitrospira sp.]|nr:MAG: hypothetical protein OJF52_000367 [Nitrospira sp.]
MKYIGTPPILSRMGTGASSWAPFDVTGGVFLLDAMSHHLQTGNASGIAHGV